MEKKDLKFIANDLYHVPELNKIFTEIRDYRFDRGFFEDINYNGGYTDNLADRVIYGDSDSVIFLYILERLFGHQNNDISMYTKETLLSEAIIHYFICIAFDILAKKFTLDFIKKEFLPDAKSILELKVSDHIINQKAMCIDPSFELLVEKTDGSQAGICLEAELRTIPEYDDPANLEELMNYKFTIKVFKYTNDDSELQKYLEFSLNTLTFDELRPWFTECLQ